MDLHEHTERIKRDYPDPLSFLLIELAEMNREYWFDKHREKTQGAEMVRETGLTPNQNEWARQIAEQMGVDHPAYRETGQCRRCNGTGEIRDALSGHLIPCPDCVGDVDLEVCSAGGDDQ